MRYLIVSDMHGNCDAFEAVLRRVRRKRFDGTLVLGDLVGYGAGPNQVVEAVRDLSGAVFQVRGNHDKVVAGIEDGHNFNPAALEAARWTSERLTPANLRLVRELAIYERDPDAVVNTAEQIITARPQAEADIIERARTQLRMVLIGALNWQSRA